MKNRRIQIVSYFETATSLLWTFWRKLMWITRVGGHRRQPVLNMPYMDPMGYVIKGVVNHKLFRSTQSFCSSYDGSSPSWFQASLAPVGCYFWNSFHAESRSNGPYRDLFVITYTGHFECHPSRTNNYLFEAYQLDPNCTDFDDSFWLICIKNWEKMV